MPGPSNYYPGVYRGTVYSVKDPLSQGRLKLRVPQLFADQQTEWAWPLDAAGIVGQAPEVGQGVWVMFEGGDPAYPIWVGTFGLSKYLGAEAYVPVLPIDTYPETIQTTTIRNKSDTLNITATLVSLATKVEELEERIAVLEEALP